VRKIVQLTLLVAVFVATAFAGEVAQLRNGFSIRFDRKEVMGATTRLYLGQAGHLDVATTEIASFAPDDTPSATPTSTEPAKTVDDHIAAASRNSGIDPDFLTSLIRQESSFNPRAVSPKGAQGLMQLMPGTAAELGVRDSLDPVQNIRGGTEYLRQLLVKYNGDAQKALAAYNAGPHRVEQYNGVPPYRETRAYVSRIINDYNRKKASAKKNTKQTRTLKSARTSGATTGSK
jgi:soluble lytic murein transglycosylase-like protein